MTVGKKIETYRTIRNLSQKSLAKFINVSESTIRKFENGERTPTLDQLQSIADALGFNVVIFLEFPVVTVSHVLSLIFAIDESAGISLEGTRNEKGELLPESLSIRLDNDIINDKLAKWDYSKILVEKTKQSRNEFKTEEDYIQKITEMETIESQIKQHLMKDIHLL
ncbi:MAG: helix-turn-helix transcriptional regulator [Eubacteriales bacterium]